MGEFYCRMRTVRIVILHVYVDIVHDIVKLLSKIHILKQIDETNYKVEAQSTHTY